MADSEQHRVARLSYKRSFVTAAVCGLAACGQVDSDELAGPWLPRVVATFEHDPNAFTQGLTVHNGYIYEGTGHYGRSSVRRVDINSGNVERIIPIDGRYFGEGITIFTDRLYQLTWKSGVGFVYNVNTFELIGTFRYRGEGWGLTHDDEHLILSDGTATLRFIDPDTFEVAKTLAVSEDATPVVRLNELEYVDGEIWANVWYDDRVARISPESGQVLGWIDLSGLHPRSQRSSEAVLNGIAYDREADRLFVTGKNWPRLFEIEVPK